MFDCRDVVFIVGEGEDHDIPIGIDKALEKMQREEQCILYLGPRYGFGEAGKPRFGIEPNAELVYEVTLKSFEKVRNRASLKSSWTSPSCSCSCALGGLAKHCLVLCLLSLPMTPVPTLLLRACKLTTQLT